MSGFGDKEKQLDLWEDAVSEGEADDLQAALDALRDRYGVESIRRASDLDFAFSDDNRR